MGLASSLLVLAFTTVFVTDIQQPAGVTAGRGDSGNLLTGPTGTPLYTDAGQGYLDDCAKECLVAWPPLLAKADDTPVGGWAPKKRADGIVQWTYKGALVYLYAADQNAHRATGDGVGGRWRALQYSGPTPEVPVPAAVQIAKAGAKFRLTDYRGYTVYTFARDGRLPACRAECLDVWPPVPAPALATPIGEWTPVDRPDGIRQWAYRGHLVYSFSDDQEPGENRGDGAGGAWKVIEVTTRDAQSAPPRGEKP